MKFAKSLAPAFVLLKVCTLLLFLVSTRSACGMSGSVGCPLIAPPSAYFPSIAPLSVCDIALGELQTAINEYLSHNPIPFYSISVVHENETVLTKGLADTPFLIGSISKTFTALGALILRERGLLSLDDPVKKFLPNFTVINPYEPHDITLRELMGHMAGLPRELCASLLTNGLSEEQCPVDESDVLEAVANMELIRPAWSREPAYSNLGFGLLGHSWEKATSPSKSWQDFVAEDIVQPLGMSNTGVNLTGIKLATNESGANYDFGWVGPAASMYSTATNLAKYLIFLINAQPALVSGPTIREWTYSRTIFPDGTGGFALPWELLPLDVAGREFLITKSGYIASENFTYSSTIAIHGPTKLGVSVLTAYNSSLALPSPVAVVGAILNVLIPRVEAANGQVIGHSYGGQYVCPGASNGFVGGIVHISESPSVGLSASINVSLVHSDDIRQTLNLTSAMLLKNATQNSFWMNPGTDCSTLFMSIGASPDTNNPNHPGTTYFHEIEFNFPNKTLLWPAYGAVCKAM